MFFPDFQKVEVPQRCCETDQNGDDGNKSTGSVSDILLKHDLHCFRTNLYLSPELLNDLALKLRTRLQISRLLLTTPALPVNQFAFSVEVEQVYSANDPDDSQNHQHDEQPAVAQFE